MPDSALTTGPIARLSEAGMTRMRSLAAGAVLLGAMGLITPPGLAQLALITAAATLLVISLAMAATAMLARRRRRHATGIIADFIERDATPSFVVSPDGEITSANATARKTFSCTKGDTLASALRNNFANPGGIIFRLKARADAEGAAREDIVTRKGHMRLAVHRMGGDAYLWRLEAVTDGDGPLGGDGPSLPMIMVGRSGTVLFMNEAARTLVGQRVKSLDRLFPAMPVRSGCVMDVSTADGTVQAQISEMEAGAGRRAIYLLPVPDAVATESWSAFQDLPVPLLRIAPDGTIAAFNRMAGTLVGDSLAEGVRVSDLMEGLGRPISDWISETMTGRAVQHTEFLRVKRSDRETFVQVALNRVSEDGAPAIIAVLSDATELKTLEAQFVQSQKMQAIGQLAGGVAHDFNNLLTAISGHCDLLLLRHDQGDADYNDLVQINQNANRAAALVGQLLAFSRKQTLRPEPLDLRDTLSDLTHLLNRLVGEKVSLTLSHDPLLPTIRADKRQLEQVLMNLVVNARDAMPQGGEIRIETEHVILTAPMERDQVTVPEGDYVSLRVIDQGSGIPRDKQQKVFEPFYTTKRTGEGTGLGLSTAYGIVKQTGGFIFVDSEVGSGTCFNLMFPVHEEAEAAVPPEAVKQREVQSAAAAPTSEPKHGDGVILLVEDEAPVRAFASRALRLRGYTVLEAECAEAALKTLEDPALNVDLFVTDVVMPGRDGPSWVREAMEKRPDVRVVFVSGYAEDRLNEEQTRIPNSVFLPKPFSLNELTATVHAQLH